VSDKPTLLLIDGHSLAFRAFYALSADSFRAPDGQHTNAVHGFISMLLNILEKERPSHICVAFDVSRESFRTVEYPEYKGTRGETPEEFIGQTEILTRALALMNIKTVSREGFEADDLLASLAKQGEDSGHRVLVVSGDRDTFQLISDDTTILYPVKGVLNLARMDDAAVFEKYAVHSWQYPDLAALVGETSDNLPGIPGVGPKTAAKWLAEYGDLESVLNNADKITGKVGESLREHIDKARRNRRLNRLLRDLEFDFAVDDLGSIAVDETAIKSYFSELGFRSLLTRVLKLRGVNGSQHTGSDSNPSPTAAPSAAVTATATASAAADAFGTVEIDAQPGPALVRDLPPLQLASAQEISAMPNFSKAFYHGDFSVDTCHSIGFATEEWRRQWDGSDPTVLLEILRRQSLGSWDHKQTEHRLGFKLAPSRIDLMLANYVSNPLQRSYLLAEPALALLGIELLSDNPNELLSEVDHSAYAWAAASLEAHFRSLLESTGQLSVLNEIDQPAAEVLSEMEITGIRIDTESLKQYAEDLLVEANTVAQESYEILGHEVNLASPKQLQKVLFEDLGMQGTKALKTGYSTNAEALSLLFEQNQHPFLDKLLAHRDVTKIEQITQTLIRAVSNDSRIHTTYSMVGTSTGRLSSENPNLQNIPIKSAKGQRLREAFLPLEGHESLLTADYSQIEMRIMAHLSEDDGLIEAFNSGEDLHNFVGARIYSVPPAEVNPQMRSKVKAMSYGLVYGLSEYGLARQLRITNVEAKQLMSDYFSRFGGVKRFLAGVVERAKADGYTTTIHGRRRPFPELNSNVFQVREAARRAALNAPIQGSAADILKLAMIESAKSMFDLGLESRMLLQVHDELVFSVAEGELETLKKLVVDTMGGAVSLRVPLEVHVGVGANWETAGH